jgi:hypothetical protein
VSRVTQPMFLAVAYDRRLASRKPMLWPMAVRGHARVSHSSPEDDSGNHLSEPEH